MKKSILCLALLLIGCTGEQVHFADGTQTQLSHWDGRWLVINYWAEWCGPCRHEIPELNELHEDRVSHGVVVLGVNWDRVAGAKLAEVIQRMEIGFPTLRDDPAVQYGFDQPMQLPATVIISPERTVERILVGPQTAKSILASIPR
ncbi:MAG: TlpA disulfide reductase family protein [Pseudomonadota bacterium]